MPQCNLLRAFLTIVALAAFAPHAQAQMFGRPPAPKAPAPPPPVSSITLASGVTLPATPGRSTPTGQISFTAPFIHGQVRADLAGIVHMKFPRSRDEKQGAFTLRLVNGDRIVGDLIEIDEDVVVFDSPMLGEMDIPRDIVHTITRRSKSPMLIDTDFARDGLGIWQTATGQWLETDKGLSTKASGVANTIFCQIPHDAPITLVVQMDASMNPKTSDENVNAYQRRMTFSFFTDSEKQGASSTVQLVIDPLRSMATLRADRQIIVVHGASWPESKGELRITYDPETFTLQAWVGEKQILNNTVDVGPKSGRFVRIMASRLVNLRSVQMYRGIFPPGKAGVVPAEDTDGLLLVNGDRLAAADVLIADERVIAHSADGDQFKLDLEKIVHIAMRLKGRRALPRRQADIRVRLQESSVLLKLDKLTDEALTGSNAGLGKLSIPRAAIAAIECDVSGRNRAAAKSRKSRLAIMTLANGAVVRATVGVADSDLATVSAPWLAGTARIKISEIVRLDMQHIARAEPGNEMLFLTDGSQLAGSLQEITADAFALRSKLMGEFKPARKFVQSVCTNQEAALLEAIDFTAGSLGKWRTVGGRWELQRGGLLSVHNSGPRCIALALPHNGPITVEVIAHRAPPRNPNIFAWLAICATKPVLGTRKSFATLSYQGLVFDFGAFNVRARSATKARKAPPVVNFAHPNPDVRPFISPDGGATTIAWNPATSTATVWGDSRLLAAAKVKGGHKGGKYILLGANHNALLFNSVRIWKGIIAAGASDEQAIADKDVAVDKAGAATSGTGLTMTDGKVRILTDGGSLAYALADMSSILTARDSRTIVARKPAHIRVGLGRSVLLLRLKSMNAKFLEGVSPTLGSVRIPRDAVRWIENKAPDRRQ